MINVWGKVIGAFLGYLLAGPIGALFGIFIGHNFDRGLRLNMSGMYTGYSGQEQHRIQDEFFKTTFQVMGHVAKADGRISENEIRVARSIMQRMRLGAKQKQQAIQFFNDGKRSSFNLEEALLVPSAKSPFSNKATFRPLKLASLAVAAPFIPPPIIIRS